MKPKVLLSVKNRREFYIDAIEKCGGEAEAFYCPEVSLDYDGLLLCGGSDVHPRYFGQEIDGSVNIDDERDKAEFELFKAFFDAGKPIMGICRGHQLINIALGGTLIQDIPTADKHRKSPDGIMKVHRVKTINKSFISDIYGDIFPVNSSHHQALDRLGKDLVAVAVSEEDGYNEAIVHRSRPIFGVQWHPERMCFSESREDTVDGRFLFEYFINMCK